MPRDQLLEAFWWLHVPLFLLSCRKLLQTCFIQEMLHLHLVLLQLCIEAAQGEASDEVGQHVVVEVVPVSIQMGEDFRDTLAAVELLVVLLEELSVRLSLLGWEGCYLSYKGRNTNSGPLQFLFCGQSQLFKLACKLLNRGTNAFNTRCTCK